jgi:hypothetical protein
MQGTKESDLVTAVLMYALRCLVEGDQIALRHMNFGPREIEVLREMTLADLYRVESLRAHCLKIALNREVYWPMMDHLRRQRESEETEQVLIAADAPLDMMQTLFGLGGKAYSRLRRALSLDPSVGRPPEPDEESTHRLWHAWNQRIGGEDNDLLSAVEYLELHAETGVSMRAIWTLTQRWAQYGDPGDLQGSKPAGHKGADG